MKILVRRAAALAVAPVLVTAAVTVTSGTAQAATPDPAPLEAGATWLAAQLTNGVVHNNQFDFDDLGLSVDVALAADAIDRPAIVTAVAESIAPRVDEYTTYWVADGKTHVSPGSIAKAAVLAEAAGADPAAFGGDLIEQLEARVSADSADRGRISDVYFPEEDFEADFANTIGQSFAARALDTAGNADAAAVTDYLLLQQCDEGFFRLDLGVDTTATCDSDAGAVASTDVTALAVLNLQDLTDDPDVEAAVGKALAWLRATQRPDGSFGSDGQIAVSNANSTGLAGWALGESGVTAAAERAAVWVRAVQADEPAPCTSALSTEAGAIAYGPAELAEARAGGITAATQDKFRRAAAQALPALRWAPDRGTAALPAVGSGFVKAGSTQPLNALAAPGQNVCFSNGSWKTLVTADGSGQAATTVTLPLGTADHTYAVTTSRGAQASIMFQALDATKLKAKPVVKKVTKGKKIKIRVIGLAARESVTVKVGGKKVDSGKATAGGKFMAVFRATGKPGKRVAKVVGEFADRAGTATVKVVR